MKKILSSILLTTLLLTNLVGAQATSQSDEVNGIYCPTLTKNMRVGYRDANTAGQVSELQQFLIDYFNLDASKLIITGIFGRITRGYVSQFQIQENLINTGIVGAVTRGRIAKVCTDHSDSPATTTNPTFNATPNAIMCPAQNIPSCNGTLNPSLVNGCVQYTCIQNSTSTSSGGSSSGSSTTQSCTVGSATISHGVSQVFYKAQSVTAPATCQSVARTCTNGSMSGDSTYSFGSCNVINSCTPAAAETRSLTCPTGQTGSITQTRSSSCSTGTPVWSDWATTTTSCVLAAAELPLNMPKVLVGFHALTADGWLRDYIPETQSQINTSYIEMNFDHNSFPLSAYNLSKIDESVNLNKKIVFGAAKVFFEMGPTLKYTLRPDYKERFEQLWASIPQYQKHVVGFYILDEPFWDVGFATMTPIETATLLASMNQVADYIHLRTPGRPVMITYAYPTLDRADFASLIPEKVDHIGFNCYLEFGPMCNETELEKKTAKLVSLLKPNQKLYVTADGYHIKLPTTADDNLMLAQYRSWENILYSYFLQNKVGTIMPFVYQSNGTTYGIENFTIAKTEIKNYMTQIMSNKYNPLIGSSKYSPTGNVDSVGCTISGWAYDKDTKDAPVDLHLYVDTAAVPPWTGFVTSIPATTYNQTLCTSIGSCNHGFNWSVTAPFRDNKPHQFWIYAIDPSLSADNPPLPSVSATFTCKP